jgi:hypothetical protein
VCSADRSQRAIEAIDQYTLLHHVGDMVGVFTGGAEKFGSPARKTFFDSIGQRPACRTRCRWSRLQPVFPRKSARYF